MRTIKVIICSIIMFSCILASGTSVYSQVAKAIGKTAKTAAKAGAKGSRKAMVKSFATVAKSKMSHIVPQKFISKVPKSEVKNYAKNIGKTEAKRVFSKAVVNSAKEGSEHILAKSTGKTVGNVLDKKTLKTTTQKLSQHSHLNPSYVKTKDAIKKAADKVKSDKPLPVYSHTIGNGSKKAGKEEIKDIENHLNYNKANGINKNSFSNGAKPRSPNNGKNGNWTGQKGNSKYVRNPNQKLNIQGEEKTIKEWAEDLETDNISVPYKNGRADFGNVKDPGTKTGKPLKCQIDEGIDKYLNRDEMLKGGKVNREKLHEEAYKRLAKSQNKTVDEIKAFKGDAAAVERLMKKWNCSKQEVLNRCNNPKNIKRVLHECEDCKTIILVPEVYHKGMAHNGGIEAVSRAVREGAK